MSVKTWKSGTANEAWKVMICARDVARAEELLQSLAYILTNLGNATPERCAEALSALSGEEIAKGLLAYRATALASVMNAIGGETK